MIYFLSDFHADPNFKAFDNYLESAREDDLLIVLGDVGIKFENTEENRIFTEKFMSSEKKIAFIDGNHENFDHLNSFDTEVWNGGKVHRITENIVHLMRGEVYTIEGNTFFTFGGCKSSPKWKEMGLWFEGEEATQEQLQNAYENIKKHDCKIDYILTHKYYDSASLGNTEEPLKVLNDYIDEKVEFKKWYVGHWHVNRRIDDKHIAVYDILIPLE